MAVVWDISTCVRLLLKWNGKWVQAFIFGLLHGGYSTSVCSCLLRKYKNLFSLIWQGPFKSWVVTISIPFSARCSADMNKQLTISFRLFTVDVYCVTAGCIYWQTGICLILNNGVWFFRHRQSKYLFTLFSLRRWTKFPLIFIYLSNDSSCKKLSPSRRSWTLQLLFVHFKSETRSPFGHNCVVAIHIVFLFNWRVSKPMEPYCS